MVSRRNLFDRQIMRKAAIDALRKLDPRIQVKNPVMFVVLVGTVVTLIYSIANPSLFAWSVTVWLALTVLFANFAEAMAEGRGKAQADTLRRTRTSTDARLLLPGGGERRVAAAELSTGDMVVCEAGDVDPLRWRNHFGGSVNRRIGDHRRIGAGNPGVRRRPIRSHGRHPRPV